MLYPPSINLRSFNQIMHWRAHSAYCSPPSSTTNFAISPVSHVDLHLCCSTSLITADAPCSICQKHYTKDVSEHSIFPDSSRHTWATLMSSIPKPPCLTLVLLSATHGFLSACMQRGMHKTSTTSISLQQRARFHTKARKSFLFSKTTQQGPHTHATDSLLKCFTASQH